MRARGCLFACALLVLCGAAGCNFKFPFTRNTGTSTGATASAQGIWAGTDSASGLELTGFISSSDQAVFFRSDGEQYVGSAQVSGTSLTIDLSGYTQFGSPYPDGATYGTGSFSGSFSAGSSISGTMNFTTSANTAITSGWSLGFDALYDQASSLGTIAGVYTDRLAAVNSGVDPLSGASVSISSSGVMYGQGSTDGCVLNGTVTVVNGSYDIYQVSYTYGDCTGSYAVLNGVPFSGLAELNATQSPAQVIVAVNGQSSSGGHYGVVSDLTAG